MSSLPNWQPDPAAGNWACAACHWQGAAAEAEAEAEVPVEAHQCPSCKSPDVFPSDDGGWENANTVEPNYPEWGDM